MHRLLILLVVAVSTSAMAADPIISISFDKTVRADFGGTGEILSTVAGLKDAIGMPGKLRLSRAPEGLKRQPDELLRDGLAGKAFPIGNQGDGVIQTLLYQPKPNISAREGAISLWVKPENWSGDEKANFRNFFSARHGNHWLFIYKYIDSTDLSIFYGTYQKDNGVSARCSIRAWKTGEWHHIGAVWSPDALELYVDGRQKTVLPLKSTLPEDFDTILLGEPMKGDPGGTLIDELHIFKTRLTADDMAAEFQRLADRLSQSKLPPVVISVAKATPVLDGQATPGEYPTVVGGMRDISRKNAYASTQSICRFAWDEEFLHFAVSSPDRNRTCVQAGRDSDVYLDDSVELHIKTPAHIYQFLVNPAGVLADQRDRNFGWNASGFQSASSFAKEMWTVEARIPWRDLEISPMELGSLRFNLARNYIFSKEWTQLAPCRKGYAEDQHFAELVFLEQTPAFDISQLGELSQSQLDFHLDITAPTECQARLKLDADATIFSLNSDKTFNLKANQPFTNDFKRKLPSDNTLSCLLEIQGGPVLYRAQIDYTAPESLRKWYIYTDLPKKELVFVMRNKNLSAQDSTLRINFVRPDGTTAKTQDNIIPAKEPVVNSRFPLEGLAAGRYELRYELLAADGKAYFSDMEEYEYFKDGAYWDGFDGGLEETVPTPWTDVQANGDTFTCWGRLVRLGGNGLVSSMISQGKELLSRPLCMRVNGTPVAFHAECISVKGTAAVFQLNPTIQDCPLSIKVTCEFDGFMLFEAMVSPNSKLDNIAIDIPLVRELADGFDDCVSPHYKNSLKENTTFDLNAFNAPFFWCGCNEVGLMGGTATKRGWHVKDKAHSMRVAADSAETLLTLHVADTPFTAGPNGNEFSFYLNPTPVRARRVFPEPKLERVNFIIGGTSSRFFMYYHPDYGTDFWKWIMHRTKEDKRIPVEEMDYLSYQAPKGASPMSPAWNYYCQDWVNPAPALGNYAGDNINIDKRIVRDRNAFTYGCLNSKSFYDHQMVCLHNALEGAKWGQRDVKNLYFDLCWPRICGNAYHGCQWQDEFGDLIRDNDLLQLRRYFIRTRRMLLRKNPDGWMLGHVFHTRTPSDNFLDAILAGEMYDSKVVKKVAYYDVLSPELMRIAYTTRTNEMHVALSPQFLRSQELFAPEQVKSWDPLAPRHDRAIRHFLAYTTLFGLDQMFNIWTNRQKLLPPGKGQVDVFRAAIAKLGPDYHMDGLGRPLPDTPKSLAAIVSGNGKALQIVLNDSDHHCAVKAPAPNRLNAGQDIFSHQSYQSVNGQVALELEPRESAFILWE